VVEGNGSNSPNALARAADDTLSSTGPPHALRSPADREIPFNGLFRVTPVGEVIAEWMGDPDTTRPNGAMP
jgi:hypothetical protein